MEENAADQNGIAVDCFLPANETYLGSIFGPGNDVFENVAFETEVTLPHDEEDVGDDGVPASSNDIGQVSVKVEEPPSPAQAPLPELIPPPTVRTPPPPPAPSVPIAHMSLEEMQSQVFSFETDHLALRANNEYKSVLKLLVLLEAQRMTAVEDLNTLEREKSAALDNPSEFVRKLQEGDLQLPSRQAVPDVPEVDLSKYAISAKFAATSTTTTTTQLTRTAGGDAGASSTQRSTKHETKSRGGKAASRSSGRPETFNKPWTVEEQRKLEYLLIKHPPQVVEAGRWKKIAADLGNRTVKQVASRVQKYFIKLTKAGLQVPGRVPHIPKSSKKVRKVQSTLKTHSYYLSTFFPQHATTVSMDDGEPVEEIAVVKKEPETLDHCSKCSKPLEESGFRFCCTDCDGVFCADGSCQQESACVASDHNLKLVSKSHVDEDYIVDNHYLDPNYFPSKT